jgi:hypothetical protein
MDVEASDMFIVPVPIPHTADADSNGLMQVIRGVFLIKQGELSLHLQTAVGVLNSACRIESRSKKKRHEASCCGVDSRKIDGLPSTSLAVSGLACFSPSKRA